MTDVESAPATSCHTYPFQNCSAPPAEKRTTVGVAPNAGAYSRYVRNVWRLVFPVAAYNESTWRAKSAGVTTTAAVGWVLLHAHTAATPASAIKAQIGRSARYLPSIVIGDLRPKIVASHNASPKDGAPVAFVSDAQHRH